LHSIGGYFVNDVSGQRVGLTPRVIMSLTLGDGTNTVSRNIVNELINHEDLRSQLHPGKAENLTSCERYWEAGTKMMEN